MEICTNFLNQSIKDPIYPFSAGSHPLGQVLVQACGSASVAQLSSSLLLFRAGRHSSLGDEAEASKGLQVVTRIEGSSDGTYPTGSHEYRLD